MGPIPEEIVEKTWQEVAGFTPNKAHKEMMRVSNNQPELLAFLMGVTEGMDQEVREPMKNSSIELQVFRFPDSHML
jgi:hypothetical protein